MKLPEFLKNLIRKRENPNSNLTLENCVERGLLTKEEMLRLKKDRATKEWEDEIAGLKVKKK